MQTIFQIICLVGYASCQKLFNTTDRLTFKDENMKQIAEYNLYSFQFHKNFETNVTVSGTFCSANSWDQYMDECKRKKPDAKWIILREFQAKYNKVNNMIVNSTRIYNNSDIQGLIFVTGMPIIANKLFEHPKIISLIGTQEGLQLKNVAFNGPNKDTKGYTAYLEHEFFNHCDDISSMSGLFYFLSILYLIMLVGYAGLVFLVRRPESFTVQKLLVLVPFMKCWQSQCFSDYFSMCPWVAKDIQDMAKYEVSSFYMRAASDAVNTLIMMLLIFLSRGWFTNPQKLTTYQMILFGVVFLINDLILSVEG